MPDNGRILWVDDEIEMLRPHILFLEEKGYAVESAANGSDAVDEVQARPYEVVLLDEQMPGMDGLQALEAIKEARPGARVVMVTKSEEERLMEEALGGRIADYLTKPVNPSQILLTVKRLLEQERLQSEKASETYLQSFNEISRRLSAPMQHGAWTDLYRELVGYDKELDADDEGARQIFDDQRQEANRAFGRFIERSYPQWIEGAPEQLPDEERPPLSHEAIEQFVLPELEENGGPVVLFVIDCMRYDQWLEFEDFLQPLFEIQTDWHYGLLPTATPYARNAIFSGLLPVEIAERYPEVWATGEESEHSRNQHEAELLQDLLDRKQAGVDAHYEKLISGEDGQDFASRAADLAQQPLSAVVVNFVDLLAHSRSDNDVLKEIAPDEPAYRDLTRTWFAHSWLLDAFKTLAEAGATCVVTTDHGAIRSLRDTEVIGDRETSTALRYKYGRNLKCNDEHAIFVKEPETYGLPSQGMNTNYIIAKEDYYFVYPTNYHHYQRKYRDTMQHGGVSMEEMILPALTLRSRS
ncbi:MAG: PglZ domain-containing protein [Bacteroidetes bacterium QS_9_68_14]|nr:MAG: PglZ domain-containing protein [Bacteroidetes bacterium QS_9_68_14]